MASEQTNFIEPFSGQRISDIWAFEWKDYDDGTPQIFYLVFDKVDSFLAVELAGDAEHIEISTKPIDQLNSLLDKYSGEEYSWKPNKWTNKSPFDRIIGRQIDKIELAIDKPEINRTDYVGIRFNSGSDNLIIFDNGDESYMGYNSEWQPMFPETYDWHETETCEKE
jgi:hypothetical protein